MNEQIKKLAKQAGLEMCSCGCDMPTRQTATFAELIVKECANIANSLGQHEGPGDCSTAEYMKERFGVE